MKSPSQSTTQDQLARMQITSGTMQMKVLLVASKIAVFNSAVGVCASYLQYTLSFKVSEFIIGNTGTLNMTGAMHQFYFNFEGIVTCMCTSRMYCQATLAPIA